MSNPFLDTDFDEKGRRKPVSKKKDKGVTSAGRDLPAPVFTSITVAVTVQI